MKATLAGVPLLDPAPPRRGLPASASLARLGVACQTKLSPMSLPEPTPTPRTRPLLAEEWPLFRDLRIASFSEAPTAFGMTLAEAQALSDDEWRDRTLMRTNPEHYLTVLGLHPTSATPAGLASGNVDPATPHRCKILSMWIAPPARRTGLALAILADIFAWARQRNCSEILLDVTETNTPAVRLYERLGFTRTGQSEPSRSHPHLSVIEMRLSL